VNRSAQRNIPGALVLAEQAICLLRRKGAAALVYYYLGSLPFVLALLYFWSDMSRNAYAGWYCAPAAAGLALLFIWMKYWHVRCCRRLFSLLQAAPEEAWPWRRNLTVAARQALLQSTGFVILPVSMMMAFPLGWVYAFYQNLCALEAPETRSVAALTRQAIHQAALWPGQNHLFLSVISLFGLIVALNLAVALVMLPSLLRTLAGIETVFTLSGMHILNTTLLAVLGALSYLCVDPILKTAYVLRCFHGQSRHSGDDIRIGLKAFTKSGLAAVIIIAGLLVTDLRAAPPPGGQSRPNPPLSNQAYVRQLDEAIESVLKQPRFAWRMPRDRIEADQAQQSWPAAALAWTRERLKALIEPLIRWITSFLDWLKKYFPTPKLPTPEAGADRRGMIKTIFILIGLGISVALAVMLWHWWKGLKSVKSVPTPVVGKEPDVGDENVSAQDLPADEWLTLARELMAGQSWQLALRALYLSVLALLADQRRVKLARHKSNLEYYRELARRAHAEPELLHLFKQCMQAFEKAWYGLHDVSEAQWHEVLSLRTRIAEIVQRPI
jgi:hypothetical protein